MRFAKAKYYSAILHGVILILLIFGLPDFFHRQMDKEPEAISVDILPIAPVSNVKPHEKPVEKPDEKKPIAEKETARKAIDEAKKEIEKPEETPLPTLPAKERVKKKEEKKPVKKPKKDEDPLKSILESVKDTAKKEEAKEATEKKVTDPDVHEAKSDNYNADLPLAENEKDAIRSQLIKCWDPPMGAKDAPNLLVDLHVEMGEDGAVTDVKFTGDESRYNSDSFFRAAVDSARRAVKRCSPLKNLPADKYGSWKDMVLSFDPKDIP